MPAPTDTLTAILQRRSAAVLAEPAPTPDQLDLLLRAATAVPDHGRLRPWRFVVVSGPARERFGQALLDAALEERPDLPPELHDKVRMKAFAAPMQVVLIASPRQGAKVPRWEQLASAACAGYAIVLAARGLGLGAVWKSVPFWDSAALGPTLGLAGPERLLGWVNLGQPARPQPDGARPAADLAQHVTVLGADDRPAYAGPA